MPETFRGLILWVFCPCAGFAVGEWTAVVHSPCLCGIVKHHTRRQRVAGGPPGGIGTRETCRRRKRDKRKQSGGYCGGVPPLPIPNREVKPTCADGPAMQCGRVGSRPLSWGEPRSVIWPGLPAFTGHPPSPPPIPERRAGVWLPCPATAPVFLAVGLFMLAFARHPALWGQDGCAL